MSIFPRAKRIRNSRVEYRTVQKEVEDKIAAGFRIIEIHEELTQTGKITMCYASFCEYVRGKGNRLHSRKKSTPPPQPQLPSTGPTIGRAEKQPGFYHERIANLDELGPPKRTEG